ncbi:MAG: sulfotransferase [Caulobacterales bacterium]|nr:sulfotransferase [Caulobacterales bacterium]
MSTVSGYSALDRVVHRIAFLSPAVQLAAADMEDTLFAGAISGAPANPPVFITSLPRAGTTILLTALNEVPRLSSHLYRDMPFVMAPLLWSKLTGSFHKTSTKTERAHGDGVEIDYDSPEAFEEIIWRAFWPEKYRKNAISLWTAEDAKPSAEAFFQRHFRKIITLRNQQRDANARYLSKNNGNIARLPLLSAMFPDAHIIVPIRRPLSHAASLHRQHLNFSKQHDEDAFASDYMRDIGHYEFGALHRPIAFSGFAELAGDLTPDRLDYWLAYWIAGFEQIARCRARMKLVSHEGLCEDGLQTSRDLCAYLDIDPEHAAMIGAHFKNVAASSKSPPPAAPRLLARAEELYAGLVGEAG